MDFTNRHGLVVRLSVMLICVLLVATGDGLANDVGFGTATATVVAALAVAAPAALAFGNVYAGVAKTVANNVTGAAAFTVTGTATDVFQAYFNLPEYLWSPSVNQRLDVTFTSTDAAIDLTGNADPNAHGQASVDPRSLGSITLPVGGVAAIFLGGKVTPRAYQAAAADYSADLVLTVWYEGT